MSDFSFMTYIQVSPGGMSRYLRCYSNLTDICASTLCQGRAVRPPAAQPCVHAIAVQLHLCPAYGRHNKARAFQMLGSKHLQKARQSVHEHLDAAAAHHSAYAG